MTFSSIKVTTEIYFPRRMGRVLLWLTIMCTHVAGAKSGFNDRKASGSFFTRETGYANDRDNNSMMFQNIYYQCGAKPDCTFVVFHTQDGSYKTISRFEDLPRDKQHNKVWRKIPERIRSCSDWHRNGAIENGIYPIMDFDDVIYSVYCDLNSEENSTWTLLTSFSLQNIDNFKVPMMVNSPKSENHPNWENYRLSKSRMTNLGSMSTLWRATCDFPIIGIDYFDYLRADLREIDLFGSYEGQCKPVQYINVAGKIGNNVHVPFYQKEGAFPLHIDVTHVDCGFIVNWGSSQDLFGFYGSTNAEFRCTQTGGSTTQYWFGNKK